MSWQISIPYRCRSDSLIDVADAARELSTDEDRAVARQLVLGAIVDGSATTAGELLDQLEKATPAERREVLDAARVKGDWRAPRTSSSASTSSTCNATHK